VIEIDDNGIITLMHDATGDTSEGVLENQDLFSSIKVAFDSGEDVQVNAEPSGEGKFLIVSLNS